MQFAEGALNTNKSEADENALADFDYKSIYGEITLNYH